MKALFKTLLATALFGLLIFSCAPSHVSVGVGVGVGYPGPWVGGPYGGPYPGGSVWVGRPMPTPYYPVLPENRQFVDISASDLDKKQIEKEVSVKED